MRRRTRRNSKQRKTELNETVEALDGDNECPGQARTTVKDDTDKPLCTKSYDEGSRESNIEHCSRSTTYTNEATQEKQILEASEVDTQSCEENPGIRQHIDAQLNTQTSTEQDVMSEKTVDTPTDICQEPEYGQTKPDILVELAAVANKSLDVPLVKNSKVESSITLTTECQDERNANQEIEMKSHKEQFSDKLVDAQLSRPLTTAQSDKKMTKPENEPNYIYEENEMSTHKKGESDTDSINKVCEPMASKMDIATEGDTSKDQNDAISSVGAVVQLMTNDFMTVHKEDSSHLETNKNEQETTRGSANMSQDSRDILPQSLNKVTPPINTDPNSLLVTKNTAFDKVPSNLTSIVAKENPTPCYVSSVIAANSSSEVDCTTECQTHDEAFKIKTSRGSEKTATDNARENQNNDKTTNVSNNTITLTGVPHLVNSGDAGSSERTDTKFSHRNANNASGTNQTRVPVMDKENTNTIERDDSAMQTCMVNTIPPNQSEESVTGSIVRRSGNVSEQETSGNASILGESSDVPEKDNIQNGRLSQHFAVSRKRQHEWSENYLQIISPSPAKKFRPPSLSTISEETSSNGYEQPSSVGKILTGVDYREISNIQDSISSMSGESTKETQLKAISNTDLRSQQNNQRYVPIVGKDAVRRENGSTQEEENILDEESMDTSVITCSDLKEHTNGDDSLRYQVLPNTSASTDAMETRPSDSDEKEKEHNNHTTMSCPVRELAIGLQKTCSTSLVGFEDVTKAPNIKLVSNHEHDKIEISSHEPSTSTFTSNTSKADTQQDRDKVMEVDSSTKGPLNVSEHVLKDSIGDESSNNRSLTITEKEGLLKSQLCVIEDSGVDREATPSTQPFSMSTDSLCIDTVQSPRDSHSDALVHCEETLTYQDLSVKLSQNSNMKTALNAALGVDSLKTSQSEIQTGREQVYFKGKSDAHDNSTVEWHKTESNNCPLNKNQCEDNKTKGIPFGGIFGFENNQKASSLTVTDFMQSETSTEFSRDNDTIKERKEPGNNFSIFEFLDTAAAAGNIDAGFIDDLSKLSDMFSPVNAESPLKHTDTNRTKKGEEAPGQTSSKNPPPKDIASSNVKTREHSISEPTKNPILESKENTPNKSISDQSFKDLPAINDIPSNSHKIKALANPQIHTKASGTVVATENQLEMVRLEHEATSHLSPTSTTTINHRETIRDSKCLPLEGGERLPHSTYVRVKKHNSSLLQLDPIQQIVSQQEDSYRTNQSLSKGSTYNTERQTETDQRSSSTVDQEQTKQCSSTENRGDHNKQDSIDQSMATKNTQATESSDLVELTDSQLFEREPCPRTSEHKDASVAREEGKNLLSVILADVVSVNSQLVKLQRQMAAVEKQMMTTGSRMHAGRKSK